MNLYKNLSMELKEKLTYENFREMDKAYMFSLNI